MKLEVGKYYKTRDGRKVGPICEFHGQWTVAGNIDGMMPMWNIETGESQFFTEGPGSDNPELDLISEWPSDGPVRTVTRREIVPGVYGRIRINDAGNEWVHVGIDRSHLDTRSVKYGTVTVPLTIAELRAAAETLIEIADALEDE